MRTEEMWGHQISVDEPVTAGDCQACGGEVYDYEVTQCELCGNDMIHKGCVKKCFTCGISGCASCIKQSDIDLEDYCQECIKEVKEDE